MPKRLALRLVNLVWYSTALLIVLVAILVTTGRELLPHINFDNQRLLAYINQRTGANIQATDLRCQWTQWYPEFSANHISVEAPNVSAQLEHVRITVDILDSLLHREPVFDQLELTEANIVYHQTEQAPQPTGSDIEKDLRVANLLLNNDVSISNVNIEIHSGEKIRKLHLNDLRVDQQFSGKKIFLSLLNDNGKQDLYLVGEISGHSLDSGAGKLYVKGENLLPSDLMPTLLQKSQLSGEAWINWQDRQEASVVSHLTLTTQPTSNSSDDVALPSSITTELSARWEKDETSFIDLHSLTVPDQKSSNQLSDIRISVNTDKPDIWRIQTPALDLQTVMTANHYLPDGTLKSLFTSLNPRGVLRNVDLVWDNSKPLTERMALRANADNIDTGAWNGVPAFTQVSGYIQSGIGYGFIDLDSHNGFSMFYPQVYREPMKFERAAGRVQWQWQPDRQRVLVGSDYASLYGEAGEARGNFWLDIPMDHHPVDMYLAIGLRNSQARYRDTFLPYVLPHNLLAWLKASIGDADIPDAGFIFRGPLSGAAADAIQFYADVNHGELTFDPAWPPLSQLTAHLLVDDGVTTVRATSGQLYNTAIEGAHVEVIPDNPGLLININGRARGYAEDGLRILKETPLKAAVGNGLDNWHMSQGSLSTALQLQIPVSGATTPQTENIYLSLSDAELDMQDLRLPFKKVAGNISYNTNSGLNSPDIAATLFNQPTKITITSQKTSRDTTINVSAEGSATIADVADWSGIKPLNFFDGPFDYKAMLKLGPFGSKPTAQLGQLQISSNLTSVSAPLPAPFTKKRGEQKPFSLTVDLLHSNQQNYRVDYNKQISAAMSIHSGSLQSGEVVLLGDTATIPPQSGDFIIRGTLPSADMQQWVDALALFNKLATPSFTNTNTNTNTNIYPSAAFTINNATWKDMSFPTLQLSANHDQDAWRVYFDAGNTRGNAFFYDNNAIPDIALSTLKFYRNKKPATIVDIAHSNDDNHKIATASAIDFSAIPSLNIRIDHLFVDDMDIGNISTELRSTGNSLRFEKLMATGQGYQLRDGTGTSGSTLLWEKNADGSQKSEFHGLLHMSGEQPALASLGVDMFIIGKNIDMFADVTWPDSPQDVAVNKIAGNLYVAGKDGKYLQAKPNAAMRVLGILNIATWARRLQLDFSDLGSDGISFDEFKGKLTFGNSVMQFSEPLEVKSPSSSVTLSGKAQLDTNTLDLRLIATLPVGNNATWVAALAGGLPAAAGVYVVSKVFDSQINKLTSLSYRITGQMGEPDVQFERIAPSSDKPSSDKTSNSNKKAPAKSSDETKWFGR